MSTTERQNEYTVHVVPVRTMQLLEWTSDEQRSEEFIENEQSRVYVIVNNILYLRTYDRTDVKKLAMLAVLCIS